MTYVFNALNFKLNGQTFSNAIYYGLLALAFGLVSAFLMSFTKQNSGARRIFRFMGWAGSLVVLIVSVGLPEQELTDCYRCLPFVPLPLCLRSGSHEMGRKRWDRTSWSEEEKQGSLGRLLYRQVFLLVALVYLLANPVVQMLCFSLVNRVNGALLLATFITIVGPKIPSMLGIRQLFSIKKVIVWQAFCLIDPDFLSGD